MNELAEDACPKFTAVVVIVPYQQSAIQIGWVEPGLTLVFQEDTFSFSSVDMMHVVFVEATLTLRKYNFVCDFTRFCSTKVVLV